MSAYVSDLNMMVMVIDVGMLIGWGDFDVFLLMCLSVVSVIVSVVFGRLMKKIQC